MEEPDDAGLSSNQRRAGNLLAALFSPMAAMAVGEIQQPRGTWQTPGEIQQPKGAWQKPGEIQIPKGIRAISHEQKDCEQRLAVLADALFEFNQASLTPDAEQTLKALLTLLGQQQKHPLVIEGHTDAIGSTGYNQSLSERRAAAVKEWLVAHGGLPGNTVTKGYGESRPVAPNTNPDGTDDPAGRQKNRRVELVVRICETP